MARYHQFVNLVERDAQIYSIFLHILGVVFFLINEKICLFVPFSNEVLTVFLFMLLVFF